MEFILNHYLHGKCETFAIILHQVTGWKIEGYFDFEALDDELNPLPPCLVHAYCVHPSGTMVDASGVITDEMLGNDFGPVMEGDKTNMSLETVKGTTFYVVNEFGTFKRTTSYVIRKMEEKCIREHIKNLLARLALQE